jgi:general transcription factor 3C polypeptide 3 (transcription factor C subunit 4)
MDFGLVDAENRHDYFVEKGSYTAKDHNGNIIINDDLDSALLMLYGHILYSGGGYAYSLSKPRMSMPYSSTADSFSDYFFRAYALDPRDSMVNLSLGLGFTHYALKRQSENRHFLIMQGLKYMFTYYTLRQSSPLLEQRQEAAFNMARTYHMLGLTHLALPYYEETLDIGARLLASGKENQINNFIRDAAYDLQNLYAMVGNLDMARSITNKWLTY